MLEPIVGAESTSTSYRVDPYVDLVSRYDEEIAAARCMPQLLLGAHLSSSTSTHSPALVGWLDLHPILGEYQVEAQLAAARRTEHRTIVQALSRAGIDPSKGLALLDTAKSVLKQRDVRLHKVHAVLTTDPEDDQADCDVQLVVHASFDDALSLEREVSQALVHSFDELPDRITISVQDVASTAERDQPG